MGQQGCDDSRQKAVEPPQNPSTALWREMALNVGYDENQQAKQGHYLDDVIEEEKQASPHASACVHAEGVQPAAKQPLQPAHPQNFILDEIPH